jgi:hypothetical protein
MKSDTQDLRRLLSRLPNAPVASNFTSRVLQAVELEESRASRSRAWRWNWHLFLPRAAVAAVVVVAAGFAFQQYAMHNQCVAIGRSVAFVTQKPLPSVEALQNFDAIQRMSQPAHADKDLLALLQ